MPIIFMDSFEFIGDGGDAKATPFNRRDVAAKWDIVNQGTLKSYVIAPADDEPAITPAEWALECGNNRIGRQRKSFPATTEVVVGMNLSWESPSSNFLLGFEVQFHGAQGVIAGVELTDRIIRFVKGTNTFAGVHGFPDNPEAAIGIIFEFRCKVHPSLGTIGSARFGGDSFSTPAMDLGTDPITGVSIGTLAQNPTLMQVNNFYIRDVEGENFISPIDYVGSWNVKAVTPKEVTTSIAFTDWDNTLDPKSGTDDTTVATGGAVGAQLTLAYPVAPSEDASTIMAVQVNHLLAKTGTEPLAYKHQLWTTDGSKTESQDISVGTLDKKVYTHIMREHPGTGNPLVIEDLEDLEAGIAITSRGD